MRNHVRYGPVFTCIAAIFLLGCEAPPEPSGFDGLQLSRVPGPGTALNGQGDFLVTIGEGFLGTFELDNVQVDASGAASGSFRFSLVFVGELLEFEGVTTCLTVDAVNRRAWVGGVTTVNNSTHPGWMTEVHEPGRDIWFRVVDNGGPRGELDRTTFVGFEGDRGIITSEEYCDVQFWDEEAEPWAVVEGDLQLNIPGAR